MKFSKADNQEPIIIASDDGPEYTARFTKANVRAFLEIDEERSAAAKATIAAGEVWGGIAQREFEDRCILAVFDSKEIVAGLLDELEPSVVSMLCTHVAARCVGVTPEHLMEGVAIVNAENTELTDAEKNAGTSSGDTSGSLTEDGSSSTE